MRQVIQQTARRTVRRVYRAKETPCFRKQFTDSSRLQFSKERTTMNASKVRYVTVKVQLFRDNRVTADL